MSQRDLSFSGCSPAYISRIEAGDRIPSLQLLRELGRRLGVTEDYLATGDRDQELASRLVDAEVALRLDERDEARTLYTALFPELRDDGSRSRAHEGLGRLAYREGELGDAVKELELALELAGDDVSERPVLVETLVRAYSTLGELAQAIALLRRALEAGADDATQLRFSALLATVLVENGSAADAERVLADALERASTITDPYARARLLRSRSRRLADEGQMVAAQRSARSTLELLRVTEDGFAVAHVGELLASVCTELDRPQVALRLLDEGRAAIAAMGTPEEQARYRLEEARALLAVGRKEEARAVAGEVAHGITGSQPAESGRALLLLGEISESLGDTEHARELYERAVERLERTGASGSLVTAYRRLADVLKALGRRDEAFELLERAVSLQEQAGRVS